MFFNGQWVKFDGLGLPMFRGAFRARDGKIVGIYQPAHRGDPQSVPHPEQICVCNEIGHNLEIDVNGVMMNVVVHTAQLGLEAISNRQDIPPDRIRHLPKDWQPNQGR